MGQVWDKALFQQRQQLVEVGDRCPLALAVMPRFDGSLLLCAPRGCIEVHSPSPQSSAASPLLLLTFTALAHTHAHMLTSIIDIS